MESRRLDRLAPCPRAFARGLTINARSFQFEDGPLTASAIVSSLPMVLLLFQKAFTHGLFGGSSKRGVRSLIASPFWATDTKLC